MTIFWDPWSRVWCASATDVFLGKWRNELMHRKNPDQKIFITNITKEYSDRPWKYALFSFLYVISNVKIVKFTKIQTAKIALFL